MMPQLPIYSLKEFHFPNDVASHAVWNCHCFAMSLPDVEGPLASQGIEVSSENMAKGIEKNSYYSVSDWLSLHGFDVTAVKETLLNIKIPHTPISFGDTKCPLQLSAEDAWELASQAITDALPKLSGDIGIVRDNCERVFDAPEAEQPHALDRGAKQVPFVSLCYQGTPADVLCVAHEFGHALQYHLVSDRFVPPVWREFAAFVAEKMLLGFIQKNRPDLYAPLYAAWRKDSTIYFGKDTKQLQDAMCVPTAPYIYRINYPIARHLADQIFDASADYDLTEIFHGTFCHPAFLSVIHDRNEAYKYG